jgi:predicted acyl esterase
MTETGGIVVEDDVMMPARDGVLLATDIYRPEGQGHSRCSLERTPYD